jgi:signal transduction histidine kinase
MTPAFTARLSTGVKMLIILSFALLPLGMIAVFASRESAHVNRLRHEAEARAVATAAAATITSAITPGTLGLRQAMNDLSLGMDGYPIDRAECRDGLQAVIDRNAMLGSLAMFDAAGRIVCSTSRFVKVPAYLPSDDTGFDVRIATNHSLLLTTTAAANRQYFGVAQFPAEEVAKLLPHSGESRPGITLRQGSQSITVQNELTRNPLDQIVRVTVPVASGQLSLEMRMPAPPLVTIEVLLILLPNFMWAAGGIIGWIVVDRLLLRPLVQMQRAVAIFSRGEGPLALPRLKTPAREINALGDSFQRATDTLTAHEAELAEGLANQKRLTREVHHRVKNNLQVVSSLINLHSRGTTDEAVVEAYASIQRRVDALAVVHRNHFAELEEHQGVSLRALIGEIASNLRASATHEAMRTTITLNIMSATATQDVAVPIAFLITEIVELVMICGPDTNVAISLIPAPHKSDRAMLSISSRSLAMSECLDGPTAERFQRIVGGLARQLRSPLSHDISLGCYTIDIPILTS